MKQQRKNCNFISQQKVNYILRFQYFAHLASVGYFRQVQTCSLPSLDHPPEPLSLDGVKNWDFQSSAFPCTYQESQMQNMSIGGSSVVEEPTLSNYSCVPISQTRNEWIFHFPLFPPFLPLFNISPATDFVPSFLHPCFYTFFLLVGQL